MPLGFPLSCPTWRLFPQFCPSGVCASYMHWNLGEGGTQKQNVLAKNCIRERSGESEQRRETKDKDRY
ncbi:14436_t:CDS:2 [Funneliformis caledonium]|uniref:14436_t:CDS:1 n=1 Tax=Funneliformis caledonium TaxID=1117310 RepID=A0A9N9FH34_9GLOM|nr:14436_t:CDS:2 [Funneliformis caledonium]